MPGRARPSSTKRPCAATRASSRRCWPTASQKNAKDKNGRTALSYALKYGNKTAADVLRKNGVEDVPWESNLDDAALLGKPLGEGRGLRSGTSSTPAGRSRPSPRSSSSITGTTTRRPDEKLLANGHIRPEELKGLPVYVFASHDHGDHFDRQILEWKKTVPGHHLYLRASSSAAQDGVVYPRPPRRRRRSAPRPSPRSSPTTPASDSPSRWTD